MSPDWPLKSLGAVCDIRLGKTPARANRSYWDLDRSTGNIWLSVADLLKSDEDGRVTDSKEYLTDSGAVLVPVVQPGTLLVSFKLTLGRLAFAGTEVRTNEAIAALPVHRGVDLSPRFLRYYLMNFDWDAATDGDVKLKGKTLNKAKLKEIPVPLPPLAEQRRIVALLDEAFDGIATSEANAERNLAKSREVFESELDSVFSRIGDGYTEATLGAEVDLLPGFAFKSSHYTESEGDVRLLRGDNIVPGGLRWTGVKRWPAADAAEYDRFLLEPGDVVVAMDRPWVSSGLKHAMISHADLPALLVQRVARLRCKDQLEQRYLMYLVGSVKFMRYITGIQTGSGVPHISGGQIHGFRFAKPPVEDQRRVADRLDRVKALVVELESVYVRKIQELAALKASLLNEAFSGNL